MPYFARARGKRETEILVKAKGGTGVVVKALETVPKAYKDLSQRGKRLGTIIQRMGWKELEKRLTRVCPAQLHPNRPTT